MSDMYCVKCAEPWDTSSVRNELLGGDEAAMPGFPAEVSWRPLLEAWVASDPYCGEPEEKAARDALHLAVYMEGLKDGCPACWYEPERATPEARERGLEAALCDGTWDGDPAVLF